MRIYLGGPISGCTEREAYAWRILLVGKVSDPHTCYVPWPVSAGRDQKEREHKAARRDFKAISTSDIAFFNLTYGPLVSVGSLVELGFASSFEAITVVVVLDEGGVYDHAFVREAADFVFYTYEEAVLGLLQVLEEKEIIHVQ